MVYGVLKTHPTLRDQQTILKVKVTNKLDMEFITNSNFSRLLKKGDLLKIDYIEPNIVHKIKKLKLTKFMEAK